jgi:hypothetical protein
MVFSMKLNFCQLNRVKNGLNAVSMFAQLGDEEQVLDLLSAGGKKEDAIYGYALGGHVDKVNALLKTNPELITCAATGYARANNKIETEKLATSNDRSLKKALLEGYAEAANSTQIYAAIRSKHSQEYLSTLVTGLALVGHPQTFQFATNEKLQNLAITAAALSGNVILVNKLLALQDIFLDKLMLPLDTATKTALGHALVGYSKGRHYEHVEQLLAFDLNPMLCLTAISDTDRIHESDIHSLSHHIADQSRREALLDLIKVHFKSEPGEKNQSFSSDSELERLLEISPAPLKSETFAASF